MDTNLAGSIVFSRRVRAMALLLLVFLAAGLRFHRLDHLPLWNDESIQLNGIAMPYRQLVDQHLKSIDHMPPLSFSIQRIFWKPDQSIYAAKVPGVLAGVALVLVAFFSMRKSGDDLLGLLVALFTATLFYLVYYSQELRCYIFFGLGLWLFLGTLIEVLAVPIGQKVPVTRCLFLVGAAVLSGSFHYAIQLLLPTAGMAAMLALGYQYCMDGGRKEVKAYGLRVLLIFLLLVTALALCYFEMKYFMGGKLQGMLNAAKDHPAPPVGLMYDVFLRFTWGGGWRMAFMLLVMLCGWFFACKRDRFIMLFAGSLCLLSFLLCFYVYPKFGQRPASMASVRYMFWISWCVVVLLGCGVHSLWMRFVSGRSRVFLLAILVIGGVATLMPAYAHYYRMDAKRMNLTAARRAIEAVGGDRMLLLGNSYDMHHLQSAWPTNCSFAALPVYEGDEGFLGLHLDKLIRQLPQTFPNIIVKKSSYEWSAVVDSFESVKKILYDHIVVQNDPHAEALFKMGLNPMVGKTMEYALLSDASLMQVAMGENQLLLYPGRMPLMLTRTETGDYRTWRLLQEPLDFIVLNPGPEKVLHISIPIARIGTGTLKIDAGGVSKMISIQPAKQQIYAPDGRGWMEIPMDLQQLANIGYRLPMVVAVQKVEFDLPMVPGENRFRMTPFNQSILLGPPPVEYTLQRDMP